MKHTLHLLITLLFLNLCATGNAQTPRLEVMDIRISADTAGNIPTGIQSAVAMVVENTDSVALPMGDSIRLWVQVQGVMFEQTIIMSSMLDTGQQFEHNFGDSNLASFSSSIDTFAALGVVTVYGDSTTHIDSGSIIYQVSNTVDNDWAATGIEIISPAGLNGFDIDNGTNIPPPITELIVELTNEGAVTYIQFSPIDYRIYVGSDIQNLQGILFAGDVSTGQSTARTITNQALIPTIPALAGAYSLCASPNVSNDANSTNDEACNELTIVDNFDPSNPDNWPNAIEEQPAIDASVSIWNDQLRIEDFSGSVNATLIDLSGKVIHTQRLDGNSRLDMSLHGSGIYFVKLEQGNLEPEFHKVILP